MSACGRPRDVAEHVAAVTSAHLTVELADGGGARVPRRLAVRGSARPQRRRRVRGRARECGRAQPRVDAVEVGGALGDLEADGAARLGDALRRAERRPLAVRAASSAACSCDSYSFERRRKSGRSVISSQQQSTKRLNLGSYDQEAACILRRAIASQVSLAFTPHHFSFESMQRSKVPATRHTHTSCVTLMERMAVDGEQLVARLQVALLNEANERSSITRRPRTRTR